MLKSYLDHFLIMSKPCFNHVSIMCNQGTTQIIPENVLKLCTVETTSDVVMARWVSTNERRPCSLRVAGTLLAAAPPLQSGGVTGRDESQTGGVDVYVAFHLRLLLAVQWPRAFTNEPGRPKADQSNLCLAILQTRHVIRECLGLGRTLHDL